MTRPLRAVPRAAEGWLDLDTGWLFEHIRDAVAVIDAQRGTIRLWNPVAERLFGYTHQQIIGRSIELLLPELHALPSGRGLSAMAQLLGPVDLRGRHRSGAELQIEASFSLLTARSGDAQFILVVVRDTAERSLAEQQRHSLVREQEHRARAEAIQLAAERELVERRRTESALLESEEHLQRALTTQRFLDEASNKLATSIDYDTTLRTMARLALPRLAETCIIYALDEDQIVEGVAVSHVDPALELALEPLLKHQGRRLSRTVLSEHSQLVTSSDEPGWTLLASIVAERAVLDGLRLRSAILVPLLGRGRVLGLMLLGSTTDKRWRLDDLALAENLARRCALALDNARLYRAAQQAIAARDQFLSIAAHELRAPLSRLKSHAEVLLQAHSQGTLDDERLTWSVGRINAAVDRLATLTTDVLDLSRLRGGHLPFRPRPLELGSLLRDMEARFLEVVGEQHTLVLEMPDEACPVLVDHDRVEQIMINLLDNAAKYSPGGGEIVVHLRRADDGVLLSVRDLGIGLPEGSDQLIFEPFGRAANAEQWSVPGMGLGLHICSLIVERHGGRIAVHSDGELQGTTVTVWLPFANESPMSSGEVKQRLTNQLTLAVGYCELLATSPDLPPGLRAQALGAMHGAQGAAATLESM